MKEWLDVVNEDDEVIETTLREECHRKRLLHRAVRVFIFNTKGELFVQKRSTKKDIYPGYYEGSLSGHVFSGESYEEAAARELKEEFGITAGLKKLFKHKVFSEKEDAIFMLFILEDYDGTVKINKEEIASGEFVDIKTLQEEIAKKRKKFTPGFVKAFEMYFSEK